MSDNSIIDKEATLKVKHLLWALGIIPTLLTISIFIVTWWVGKDSVSKTEFKEWKMETKKEDKDWKINEWSPHVKESNKANISIGIILDRTDSKAVNTNSVGANNIAPITPH